MDPLLAAGDAIATEPRRTLSRAFLMHKLVRVVIQLQLLETTLARAELLARLRRGYVMAMPGVVPRYTVDDLESFPNDGNRYELLDGILLVTPAPLPFHEMVVQRLHERLSGYLGKRAWVFTRGAVEIAPSNHLEPDILVLPRNAIRPTWGETTGFWLAVEVSGRGSRVYDRDFKHRAYAALGVREVWRADLVDQNLSLLRNDDNTTVVDVFTWHPPEMPAPLVIDVSRLFEGVEDDS